MAHTDILDERLTAEGPVAKSSTFAVRFKPFMGKSEGSVTIAEYEPPRRVQLRGRMGKMAPILTLSIEPQATLHVSPAGSRWSHPASCGYLSRSREGGTDNDYLRPVSGFLRQPLNWSSFPSGGSLSPLGDPRQHK